jgi:hypothetical protein
MLTLTISQWSFLPAMKPGHRWQDKQWTWLGKLSNTVLVLLVVCSISVGNSFMFIFHKRINTAFHSPLLPHRIEWEHTTWLPWGAGEQKWPK